MSIVLSTINAGYSHPAFGLRRLLANMGDLRPATRLVEFYRRLDPEVMVEPILASRPAIIGLSVYIWNVDRLTELVRALKRRCPDVCIVLGGPEVSHDSEQMAIVREADYVICGEGDLAFAGLCRDLLRGEPPPPGRLHPEPPDIARLEDPYPEFSPEDIRRRLIYVETSRGCPFRCEYCLSSLDHQVRFFPLDPVLASLERLLDQGGLRFKFIDRTFNLKMDRCLAILEFFLARVRPGLEIQFEVVPTRMPELLRDVIRRFPPNTLRLEIGVQTFDEEVLVRIQRRQDGTVTRDTLAFLRDKTQVVVHADLIVGLPGETLDGFARSFDELLAYRPAELQVGILKRLRGVPIARHDAAWGMVYRERPPYDLLENQRISATDMERMNRFARYWEQIWNRGRFLDSGPMLVETAPSAFFAFLSFSDWLHDRLKATHGIPLLALVEGLFIYLTDVRDLDAAGVARTLAADYQRDADRVLPRYLKHAILGKTDQ